MRYFQDPNEFNAPGYTGAKLSLVIPSKKNFLNMLFLGILLIPWALGVYLAVRLIPDIISTLFASAAAGKSGVPALVGMILFILVWFCFWMWSGANAIYRIIWQLAGKEHIEIGQDSIRIQKTILGLGASEEFQTSEIRDLRISPIISKTKTFSWPWLGNFQRSITGRLSFNYGSKTIQIGDGINEADAAEILNKVTARYPQFKKNA